MRRLMMWTLLFGAAIALDVSAATVDGLKIARTYTTKDQSGAILVGLADNALFSFSFNKLAEDEAFTLARRVLLDG